MCWLRVFAVGAFGVPESVQVKLFAKTTVEHAGGNKGAQSAQRNALAYGITQLTWCNSIQLGQNFSNSIRVTIFGELG